MGISGYKRGAFGEAKTVGQGRRMHLDPENGIDLSSMLLEDSIASLQTGKVGVIDLK